ncbi:MAG: hypothetical protein L0219_10280 [Phycisphaerales bacterium]|nr:hypothetical protein [Phycisphaerales bacterium]
MSIHLSRDIEEQLRRLAKVRGCNVNALASEAIQLYLESSGITDVTPDQIAEAQAKLASELPGWTDRSFDREIDETR